MPVDITATLKDWGVTIGFLSVAATALLVLFVISFREFATWFVRVNQVLKTQKEIIQRLKSLEDAVQAANLKTPQGPLVRTPPLPVQPEEKELFQLHS